MRVQTLLSDFFREMSSFTRERREFLELLQRWLNAKLRLWNKETRTASGLDWIATADLAPFPVELAALSPEVELAQIKKYPPSSLDIFGMFISEIFWEGITLEANSNCNNCGAGMRIMEATEEDIPVLECKQCVCCQRANGQCWEGDEILRPATTQRVLACRELWAPNIATLH